MLGFLRNLFGGGGGPAIDVKFVPLFNRRQQIGPMPIGQGAMAFAAVGSAQWFNPRSKSDRALLLSEPQAVLETDSLEVLKSLKQGGHAPHSEFLLYQPWREPNEQGARLLGAMNADMAKTVGEAVSGSPVKHLFLITGGITHDSLSALQQALGQHKLISLGLFWYYSGDDITDDPRLLPTIGELCQQAGVERLSILTGESNSSSESGLAEALKGATSVKICKLFQKDDAARYPAYPAPEIEAVLKGRGGG